MAGGIRLEDRRPKTIICEYKAGGLVRVLDSEDVVLPAHPVGRFQDLFGFIPKNQGQKSSYLDNCSDWSKAPPPGKNRSFCFISS